MIIAQPGTITGSIGVLGGKVVVSELLDKLGLGSETVAHGDGATMFSPRHRFTDDERERLSAMLDRIYREFVQKVADGRDMSYDDVHQVARGRIWSGADAVGNGLVDRLGGAARRRGRGPLAGRAEGRRAGAPGGARARRSRGWAGPVRARTRARRRCRPAPGASSRRWRSLSACRGAGR